LSREDPDVAVVVADADDDLKGKPAEGHILETVIGAPPHLGLRIPSLSTTTMAISFPPKLLGAVVAEVHSQSDLLQLRATNTTLNALATPLAFRSIQLANTDKSLERFKRLAKYPKFAELIHKVVYQYEEADPSKWEIVSSA
jgi:hypothetical protein